jgi:hypothetical protein
MSETGKTDGEELAFRYTSKLDGIHAPGLIGVNTSVIRHVATYPTDDTIYFKSDRPPLKSGPLTEWGRDLGSFSSAADIPLVELTAAIEEMKRIAQKIPDYRNPAAAQAKPTE